MAYSEFTLESALRILGLRLDDRVDLYHDLPSTNPSDNLRETLLDNVPLATANHTEKARSELIVVPILLEAWKRTGRRVGFFSGVSFDVAPEKGLDGVCDFLLSRSPNQFVLGPPVFALVEAKNDSIRGGLGQCVAEMVAAQIDHQRQPTDSPDAKLETIHGAVTTGSLWQFLRLKGDQVQIDRIEYSLAEVGKILAILIDCLTRPDVSPLDRKGVA